MADQKKVFRFNHNDLLICFVLAAVFFILSLLAYLVLGKFLWIFGIIAIIAFLMGWYDYRFRMHVTNEGIKHIPGLRSFWVRWEDVTEARLFDAEHILLKLKSGKQKEISLTKYENRVELSELIKEKISAEKFRKALPPSLTNFIGGAPYNFIFAICGLTIGIHKGYYNIIWLSLCSGIIVSALYVFKWRLEIRRVKVYQYFEPFFWLVILFVFFGDFIAPKLPSWFVPIIFFAGVCLMISLTAFISNKIFISSSSNKAGPDKERAEH